MTEHFHQFDQFADEVGEPPTIKHTLHASIEPAPEAKQYSYGLGFGPGMVNVTIRYADMVTFNVICPNELAGHVLVTGLALVKDLTPSIDKAEAEWEARLRADEQAQQGASDLDLTTED